MRLQGNAGWLEGWGGGALKPRMFYVASPIYFSIRSVTRTLHVDVDIDNHDDAEDDFDGYCW